MNVYDTSIYSNNDQRDVNNINKDRKWSRSNDIENLENKEDYQSLIDLEQV